MTVGADGSTAGAGNSTVNGQFIYQITPKRGAGEDKLVVARMLVEVRFPPGDWVWFMPSMGTTNGGKSVGQQRREKAMIIGTQVLRGKRVSHINVPGKSEDRVLVPDERLVRVANIRNVRARL